MTTVFDECSEIAPVVTRRGLRVFGGVRSSRGTLRPTVVEPRTGRRVWRGSKEFAGGSRRWAPRFAMLGDAAFLFCDGNLSCFDARSGAQWWSTSFGEDIVGDERGWVRTVGTRDGGRVVCQTASGTVVVIDDYSGRVIWSDEPDNGRYRIVPGLGVLVFAPGGVASLRDANGDIVWERPMNQALAADRHLFASVASASPTAALVCYEAATGCERWRVRANALVGLDGLTSGDGAVLFVNDGAEQTCLPVTASHEPRATRLARVLRCRPGAALPVPRAVVSSCVRVGRRVYAALDSGGRMHAAVLDASTGRRVASPRPLPDTTAATFRSDADIAVARCERRGREAILRGFGPDGRLRWERIVGGSRGHLCVGRDVVVRTQTGLAVLNANDGTPKYAFVS